MTDKQRIKELEIENGMMRNEIDDLRKELSRYRVPCEECGGTGDIFVTSNCIDYKPETLTGNCPACKGLGYRDVARAPEHWVESISACKVNKLRTYQNRKWKLTRDPDDPAWWILEEVKK